jgi:hypothetical protein
MTTKKRSLEVDCTLMDISEHFVDAPSAVSPFNTSLLCNQSKGNLATHYTPTGPVPEPEYR